MKHASNKNKGGVSFLFVALVGLFGGEKDLTIVVRVIDGVVVYGTFALYGTFPNEADPLVYTSPFVLWHAAHDTAAADESKQLVMLFPLADKVFGVALRIVFHYYRVAKSQALM
ncbi:hypothetical protein AKJ16_DCAP08973 [Drosera capensis]